MTVAATSSALQKQQPKLPTSMRYDRVQTILESDLFFKGRLGPRNHAIDTRFGEKVMFSRETVEVTESIHAEGRDAHKVSQNEVLRAAMKVLKINVSGNGEIKPFTPPSPPPAPVTPPVAPVNKNKTKTNSTGPDKAKTAASEPKTNLTAKARKSKADRTVAPEPPKTKNTKPEKPKGARGVRPVEKEEPVPESELPPEQQPLRLPSNFDPRKHPHYDVAKAIYSLLLSALSVSEHYEKMDGVEQRQKKLEVLIHDYQDICDTTQPVAT